ncbi:hypothetical protein GT348_03770 [Aristophania vespae]|uniref:Uncharacterized protein n=1 Tax=Aristophania vespae TaxID=2697033 RepID=A0A6P1NG45_9PROT|nr:hypothetical protein [Aristophania vespae]QHI95500.1 hypothetical protein GT348_03770 [Aristophania vespae]
MSGPIDYLNQAGNGDLIAFAGGILAHICECGRIYKIGGVATGARPIRISDNGRCFFIINSSRNGGYYYAMPGSADRAGVSTSYDFTPSEAVSSDT